MQLKENHGLCVVPGCADKLGSWVRDNLTQPWMGSVSGILGSNLTLGFDPLPPNAANLPDTADLPMLRPLLLNLAGTFGDPKVSFFYQTGGFRATQTVVKGLGFRSIM